jgi:hypothetical protein
MDEKKSIDLKNAGRFEVYEFILKMMAYTPETFIRYVFLSEDGILSFSDAVSKNTKIMDAIDEITSINEFLDYFDIDAIYSDGYFYIKQPMEECEWFSDHVSLTETEKNHFSEYNHKHTLDGGIEDLLNYDAIMTSLEEMCSKWGCDEFF